MFFFYTKYSLARLLDRFASDDALRQRGFDLRLLCSRAPCPNRLVDEQRRPDQPLCNAVMSKQHPLPPCAAC